MWRQMATSLLFLIYSSSSLSVGRGGSCGGAQLDETIRTTPALGAMVYQQWDPGKLQSSRRARTVPSCAQDGRQIWTEPPALTDSQQLLGMPAGKPFLGTFPWNMHPEINQGRHHGSHLVYRQTKWPAKCCIHEGDAARAAVMCKHNQSQTPHWSCFSCLLQLVSTSWVPRWPLSCCTCASVR
jgi:hypothetical protein